MGTQMFPLVTSHVHMHEKVVFFKEDETIGLLILNTFSAQQSNSHEFESEGPGGTQKERMLELSSRCGLLGSDFLCPSHRQLCILHLY